ncbi:hypothetical protein POVWA2_021270 [Plasmodium ovale wallikeri]|uniref:Uncharacterized protein n=1 Tax=Plasmodium ovale wallikeri TaxID=864142 RepID=A0A1A8YT70_PLAOA|nr:hypothetical protein POVWA1_021300 [Plasmodium ovale wallikeri]SBT34715.1 hypothetical protein POVWA2_021270 [Plasmodium ovale wallikeri]
MPVCIRIKQKLKCVGIVSKSIHSNSLPSVALHNFLYEKGGKSSLENNKCTSHKKEGCSERCTEGYPFRSEH